LSPPRPLATGEIPRPANRQVDGLVEGRPSGQVVEQLPVAEGLAGGAGHLAGRAPEVPHLVEEPGVELLAVADLDAGPDHLARQPQPGEPEPRGRVGAQTRAVRRERSATAQGHLEGPHDAPAVPGLDAVRGGRIGDRQPAVEGADAGGRGRLLLEAGPHLRPLAGEREPVDHGLEVQAGAAHEQRPPSPRLDAGQRPGGGGREAGDGEVLVGVGEVEEVDGHLGPLGRGRLGRADVHPPVDAHGVDGDELDVAEAAGDLQGDGRLARRRGSDQGQVRPAQMVATGMSVRWRAGAVTSTRSPRRWWGAAPVTRTRA
jgi:hypothetical protein